MPTRLDVITVALRRAKVVGVGEVPQADDAVQAGQILDSALPELKATQGFSWTWDLDSTPQEYLVPLGYYLATELTQIYPLSQPEPRSVAIQRLRALALPDDRADGRDVDGDGTVSDAEKEASKRAAYF